MPINTFTRLSSLIGPNRSKNTLRMVRFVVSVMACVFGSSVSSTNPSEENTCNVRADRRLGA